VTQVLERVESVGVPLRCPRLRDVSSMRVPTPRHRVWWRSSILETSRGLPYLLAFPEIRQSAGTLPRLNLLTCREVGRRREACPSPGVRRLWPVGPRLRLFCFL